MDLPWAVHTLPAVGILPVAGIHTGQHESPEHLEVEGSLLGCRLE